MELRIMDLETQLYLHVFWITASRQRHLDCVVSDTLSNRHGTPYWIAVQVGDSHLYRPILLDIRADSQFARGELDAFRDDRSLGFWRLLLKPRKPIGPQSR